MTNIDIILAVGLLVALGTATVSIELCMRMRSKLDKCCFETQTLNQVYETHGARLDVISRQDAIGSKPEFLNPNVNRETEEQTAIDRAYARGWNSCNTHWIKEIRALPSAYPENALKDKNDIYQEETHEQ